MTDSKILEEIKDDFKTVTTSITGSVNKLSGKISGMQSTMIGVQSTLDRHEKNIKETREGQLKATEGIVVLNREMRDVKKERKDQTGGVPLLVAGSGNGAIIKRLFSQQYKYWVAVALLALGFWLGSRGDTEGTLRMLATMSDAVKQIGLKVSEIEKIKTEPVRVPVPITASDLYSEEIAP